jgi:hypothetical protein
MVTRAARGALCVGGVRGSRGRGGVLNDRDKEIGDGRDRRRER